MDISSMIITSASSGFSSIPAEIRRHRPLLPDSRLPPAAGGWSGPHSLWPLSSAWPPARWAPPAGCPCPSLSKNWIMALMVVVFPVPGPPVRIRIPCLTASATAFLLHLIQGKPRVLFNRSDPAAKRLLVLLAFCSNIQVMEHFGCVQFQVIIVGGIDPDSVRPLPS